MNVGFVTISGQMKRYLSIAKATKYNWQVTHSFLSEPLSDPPQPSQTFPFNGYDIIKIKFLSDIQWILKSS